MVLLSALTAQFGLVMQIGSMAFASGLIGFAINWTPFYVAGRTYERLTLEQLGSIAESEEEPKAHRTYSNHWCIAMAVFLGIAVLIWAIGFTWETLFYE